MLTQEFVRSILRYDAETGVFTWVDAVKTGPAREGRVAGSRHSKGYWRINTTQGIKYAHRLAWIYVHGDLADDMTIDHINGDKMDNRIANLRAIPHGQNLQNIRKPMKNSTTGFLGVTKAGNRFLASISLGGKSHALGSFDRPEEAHEAYLSAKRQMHVACTI